MAGEMNVIFKKVHLLLLIVALTCLICQLLADFLPVGSFPTASECSKFRIQRKGKKYVIKSITHYPEDDREILKTLIQF